MTDEYPFPPANIVWNAEDVIALCCSPGYMSPDDWRPITFTAITNGESGFDPLALGRPVWNPGHFTHKSFDIGMFQLNNWYNILQDPFPDLPRITMEDALDPFLAFDHAWKLMNKERKGWQYNFTFWTAYNNGSYDQHVIQALLGMRSYRKTMGLPVGIFGI